MESINRVELLGTITNEPLYSQVGNESIAKFTLQTIEKWKNPKTGKTVVDKQDHLIIARGRKATIVKSYLQEGSKILIDGKFTYSEPNKDGIRISEIIVSNIVFISGIKLKAETEKLETA